MSKSDRRHAKLRRQKRRARLFIYEYKKQNPCVKCGETHPVCLEFHHVRDEKKFNISRAVSKGFKIGAILKEIQKCEILCGNCHRKLNFDEVKDNGKLPSKKKVIKTLLEVFNQIKKQKRRRNNT